MQKKTLKRNSGWTIHSYYDCIVAKWERHKLKVKKKEKGTKDSERKIEEKRMKRDRAKTLKS